jgi:hypothetical protein
MSLVWTAIDPGPTQSGYAVYEGGKVLEAGVMPNDELLSYMSYGALGATLEAPLAIEMIGNYGMAVGASVFETCVWIGRFTQAWGAGLTHRIFRRDVKLHLCNSARAKDANVRQALIDRLGPVGTKRAPGPLHGVTSHAWAALAVAVTADDTIMTLGA